MLSEGICHFKEEVASESILAAKANTRRQLLITPYSYDMKYFSLPLRTKFSISNGCHFCMSKNV